MANPYRTPGVDPDDESSFGPAHTWDVEIDVLSAGHRWFRRRPTARRIVYWTGWLVVAALAGLVVAHLLGVI